MMHVPKTPEFDPWAVLRRPGDQTANSANFANPIPESAKISDFSSFSSDAPRSVPLGEVEIIDLMAGFEERAAIREYDGGLPRAEAEQLALEESAPDTNARNALLHKISAAGRSLADERSR